MRIKSKRSHEYVKCFLLCFEGDNGHGFSFHCDVDGNVREADLPPAAWLNYRTCMAGGMTREVRDYSAYQHTAAIGECECGRDVHLLGWTNPCDCGRDYNMSGALLAPREQWGEETGETWGDRGEP